MRDRYNVAVWCDGGVNAVSCSRIEDGGGVTHTGRPTVVADLVRVGHVDVRKRTVDHPFAVGRRDGQRPTSSENRDVDGVGIATTGVRSGDGVKGKACRNVWRAGNDAARTEGHTRRKRGGTAARRRQAATGEGDRRDGVHRLIEVEEHIVRASIVGVAEVRRRVVDGEGDGGGVRSSRIVGPNGIRGRCSNCIWRTPNATVTGSKG